jgi:outer membrane lipoprotein-sorting protein
MNDYLRVVAEESPRNEASTDVRAFAAGPEHMADRFLKKNAAGPDAGANLVALITALTFAAPVSASAQAMSAQDMVRKELAAFYYAGTDMSAHVSMRLINDQGNVRERDMTMLRLNTDKEKSALGNQDYMMVFSAPADVRGMSFLIYKYPQAEDDRWMYFPALKATKRIAADDKKSSFVGSDFTYEDVSGRDLNEEKHTFVRADEVAGRKVYVVESKPTGNTDYGRRLIWIDQERWLPLKEEYFDSQGKPLRTFAADKVEQIGGQWTITVRSMKNIQSGHRTEVQFKDVQYNRGFDADMFTERNMKNPGIGFKR